jgi:hypothetical protein
MTAGFIRTIAAKAARWPLVEWSSRSNYSVTHDLFRKPAPTIRTRV